ncbi:hypothetical protein RUM44_000857 [Polyplax serrata]|uniref:Homeobox domain-containing protein n=1 Tax=Polyplax serrata TaxID=468196 RepID=A0ABR1B6A4_POLSC
MDSDSPPCHPVGAENRAIGTPNRTDRPDVVAVVVLALLFSCGKLTDSVTSYMRSNVRSPLCSSASIVIALFDFNLSCYYFLIPLEKSPADISKKCGGKSKRVRTIFTPEQLERLEAEFERQQYMVGPERLYLAHTLQLTEAQVKVWFQNRRIKWRKQHLEIQQQRLAAIKQQNPNEEVEDSDDESGDSNNYSFPAENGNNNGGFFKFDTDLDRSSGQFKGDKSSSSSHSENLGEDATNKTNSENA